MQESIFIFAGELKERWGDLDPRDLPSLTDLAILGIGGKRCGVEDGDLVAKVAWREKGLWENQAEAALWEWAPPDLRKLLAPVRGFERGVLWQDRCLPVVADSSTRSVQEGLARWGITDSAKNLALLRGQIVCYDYAFFAPWVFEEISEAIAKNEQK